MSKTYMGSVCKYGHTGLRYIKSGVCVECQKKGSKAWYDAHKGTHNETMRQYRNAEAGRASQMLSVAKRRSKEKSCDFDLTKEWLESKLKLGVCELTGLPFSLAHTARADPYAPSIDRRDASGGYTQENCRIILWCLNTAFGWWGEDRFRVVAEAFLAAKLQESNQENSHAHG